MSQRRTSEPAEHDPISLLNFYQRKQGRKQPNGWGMHSRAVAAWVEIGPFEEAVVQAEKEEPQDAAGAKLYESAEFTQQLKESRQVGTEILPPSQNLFILIDLHNTLLNAGL